LTGRITDMRYFQVTNTLFNLAYLLPYILFIQYRCPRSIYGIEWQDIS